MSAPLDFFKNQPTTIRSCQTCSYPAPGELWGSSVFSRSMDTRSLQIFGIQSRFW
jgi:hypothetical protein